MKMRLLPILPLLALLFSVVSCDDDPAGPSPEIMASLSINGGASATSHLDVGLSITAENATRMMISNNADFRDGSWQAFSTAVAAWRLEAGEGVRSVHIQFGNEAVSGSGATSASIILDQTAPDVSAVLVAADAAVAFVSLSWPGCVDALSGIVEYQVRLGESDPPETLEYTGAGTSCLVSGLRWSTTYNWRLVVEDAAGNQTMAGPWSFATGNLFETILVPPDSVSIPLTFTMGGAVEPTEMPHDVTLTGRFLMSETEVTVEDWQAVMGGPGASKSQLPKWLSWDEAVLFCNALSDSDGLTRAYTINGPGAEVARVPGADGWRLPTEAEWECACRAGTGTPFNTGDCLDAGTEANYCGSYPYTGCSAGPFVGSSVDVKSYAPNAWGLYDMHGNLWEWCYDGQRKDYQNLPAIDPVFDGTPGENRLLRGGAWYNYAQYCRSAARYFAQPTYGDEDSGWMDAFGFRPVRSVTEPQ